MGDRGKNVAYFLNREASRYSPARQLEVVARQSKNEAAFITKTLGFAQPRTGNPAKFDKYMAAVEDLLDESPQGSDEWNRYTKIKDTILRKQYPGSFALNDHERSALESTGMGVRRSIKVGWETPAWVPNRTTQENIIQKVMSGESSLLPGKTNEQAAKLISSQLTEARAGKESAEIGYLYRQRGDFTRDIAIKIGIDPADLKSIDSAEIARAARKARRTLSQDTSVTLTKGTNVTVSEDALQMFDRERDQAYNLTRELSYDAQASTPNYIESQITGYSKWDSAAGYVSTEPEGVAISASTKSSGLRKLISRRKYDQPYGPGEIQQIAGAKTAAEEAQNEFLQSLRPEGWPVIGPPTPEQAALQAVRNKKGVKLAAGQMMGPKGIATEDVGIPGLFNYETQSWDEEAMGNIFGETENLSVALDEQESSLMTYDYVKKLQRVATTGAPEKKAEALAKLTDISTNMNLPAIAEDYGKAYTKKILRGDVDHAIGEVNKLEDAEGYGVLDLDYIFENDKKIIKYVQLHHQVKGDREFGWDDGSRRSLLGKIEEAIRKQARRAGGVNLTGTQIDTITADHSWNHAINSMQNRHDNISIGINNMFHGGIVTKGKNAGIRGPIVGRVVDPYTAKATYFQSYEATGTGNVTVSGESLLSGFVDNIVTDASTKDALRKVASYEKTAGGLDGLSQMERLRVEIPVLRHGLKSYMDELATSDNLHMDEMLGAMSQLGIGAAEDPLQRLEMTDWAKLLQNVLKTRDPNKILTYMNHDPIQTARFARAAMMRQVTEDGSSRGVLTRDIIAESAESFVGGEATQIEETFNSIAKTRADQALGVLAHGISKQGSSVFDLFVESTAVARTSGEAVHLEHGVYGSIDKNIIRWFDSVFNSKGGTVSAYSQKDISSLFYKFSRFKDENAVFTEVSDPLVVKMIIDEAVKRAEGAPKGKVYGIMEDMMESITLLNQQTKGHTATAGLRALQEVASTDKATSLIKSVVMSGNVKGALAVQIEGSEQERRLSAMALKVMEDITGNSEDIGAELGISPEDIRNLFSGITDGSSIGIEEAVLARKLASIREDDKYHLLYELFNRRLGASGIDILENPDTAVGQFTGSALRRSLAGKPQAEGITDTTANQAIPIAQAAIDEEGVSLENAMLDQAERDSNLRKRGMVVGSAGTDPHVMAGADISSEGYGTLEGSTKGLFDIGDQPYQWDGKTRKLVLSKSWDKELDATLTSAAIETPEIKDIGIINNILGVIGNSTTTRVAKEEYLRVIYSHMPEFEQMLGQAELQKSLSSLINVEGITPESLRFMRRPTYDALTGLQHVEKGTGGEYLIAMGQGTEDNLPITQIMGTTFQEKGGGVGWRGTSAEEQKMLRIIVARGPNEIGGPAELTTTETIAGLNAAYVNNGISPEALTGTAENLLGIKTSREQLLRGMAYAQQHAENGEWDVNISDLLRSGIDSYGEESTLQRGESVPFHELLAFLANDKHYSEAIDNGEVISEFSDDFHKVFSPMSAALSRGLTETAADETIYSRVASVAGSDIPNPIDGLRDIGTAISKSPTLSRVALAGIVIAGISAAYRMTKRSKNSTADMINMEHPGSEGATRVSMNDSGYAGTIPQGRYIPLPAGPAKTGTKFPGQHSTINVMDNQGMIGAGFASDALEMALNL